MVLRFKFKFLLDRFFTLFFLKTFPNIQTKHLIWKKGKNQLAPTVRATILTRNVQVIAYFIIRVAPNNISAPTLRATP